MVHKRHLTREADLRHRRLKDRERKQRQQELKELQALCDSQPSPTPQDALISEYLNQPSTPEINLLETDDLPATEVRSAEEYKPIKEICDSSSKTASQVTNPSESMIIEIEDSSEAFAGIETDKSYGDLNKLSEEFK